MSQQRKAFGLNNSQHITANFKILDTGAGAKTVSRALAIYVYIYMFPEPTRSNF